MAIEAMLKEPQSMEDFEFKEKAINACKEALSQEQEPVALNNQTELAREAAYYLRELSYDRRICKTMKENISELSDKLYDQFGWSACYDSLGGNYGNEPKGQDRKKPLYTHPAQPLSDDDMSKVFDQFDWKEIEIAGEHLDLFKFARAIELAHGIGE